MPCVPGDCSWPPSFVEWGWSGTKRPQAGTLRFWIWRERFESYRDFWCCHIGPEAAQPWAEQRYELGTDLLSSSMTLLRVDQIKIFAAFSTCPIKRVQNISRVVEKLIAVRAFRISVFEKRFGRENKKDDSRKRRNWIGEIIGERKMSDRAQKCRC